jgi:hypothetical protein
MLKFIHLIVWAALWIGIGDSLVHLVQDLRSSAIHAHRHGQISYEKFSRMLTAPETTRHSVSGKTEKK